MGIYFASYLVYGLRIPEDYYELRWDIEEEPLLKKYGLQFITGGDLMGGKGVQDVIHHPEHVMTAMDTAEGMYGPGAFGVFPVEDRFNISQQQVDTLYNLSVELDVPQDIGYFIVANVG